MTMPNRPAHLRGLLIDPTARTVTELTIATGDELANMRAALDCDTVTAVTVHEYPEPAGFRETLWLDDEGRLAYPNPNGYFRLLPSNDPRADQAELPIYCGRGLILATAPDGDSWPCGLPLDVVRAVVDFIDTPPESEVEPRIEVMAWPGPGATH